MRRAWRGKGGAGAFGCLLDDGPAGVTLLLRFTCGSVSAANDTKHAATLHPCKAGRNMGQAQFSLFTRPDMPDKVAPRLHCALQCSKMRRKTNTGAGAPDGHVGPCAPCACAYHGSPTPPADGHEHTILARGLRMFWGAGCRGGSASCGFGQVLLARPPTVVRTQGCVKLPLLRCADTM